MKSPDIKCNHCDHLWVFTEPHVMTVGAFIHITPEQARAIKDSAIAMATEMAVHYRNEHGDEETALDLERAALEMR